MLCVCVDMCVCARARALFVLFVLRYCALTVPSLIERFYVIHEGKIAYKATPDCGLYRIGDLQEVLRGITSSTEAAST